MTSTKAVQKKYNTKTCKVKMRPIPGQKYCQSKSGCRPHFFAKHRPCPRRSGNPCPGRTWRTPWNQSHTHFVRSLRGRPCHSSTPETPARCGKTDKNKLPGTRSRDLPWSMRPSPYRERASYISGHLDRRHPTLLSNCSSRVPIWIRTVRCGAAPLTSSHFMSTTILKCKERPLIHWY